MSGRSGLLLRELRMGGGCAHSWGVGEWEIYTLRFVCFWC